MSSVALPLATAGVYAAVLILGAVALQAFVISLRRSRRIGLGDGEDPELMKAVRIHGNYVENVPLAIAGLTLLGLLGASVWVIHLIGLAVMVGRAAHAQGLWSSAGKSTGRATGVVLTAGALIGAAVGLLVQAMRIL
jgi:uncharacterized membrane protein YecN with MAPEG domain